MLRVIVVDITAESRSQIVDRLNRILFEANEEFHFAPRVTVKPLSLDELKFHETPDLVIVGPGVVASDVTEISRIRKTIGDAFLMVKVPESWSQLSAIEQIARFGADDIVTEEITARSFLQKLILLTKRAPKNKSGKLILVTSGKGGVGVTTIAAGVAEALSQEGKKVALIDLDTDTQDLTRFLQVRPYINDGLTVLLDQSAAVSEESVAECLYKVWEDVETLSIMPPLADGKVLLEHSAKAVRVFLSVFEQLDAAFDYVVIDTGSVVGAVLEMLFRIADKVLYVVSNDPAALYASVDRLAKFRTLMGETAELLILENGSDEQGLSYKILCEEFNRATGLAVDNWVTPGIPYCKKSARWPGSGASIAGFGSVDVQEAFRGILGRLGAIPIEVKAEKKRSSFGALFGTIQKKIQSRVEQRALPQTTTTAAAQITAVNHEQKLIPEKTGMLEELNVIAKAPAVEKVQLTEEQISIPERFESKNESILNAELSVPQNEESEALISGVKFG